MLLTWQVPFMPTQRIDGNGVIPGYRGHVPNVVNAIGMSTFLSGPGFTEVKVEEMEKMGGLGDLGDSAAAYGCNDWGSSSFSDGKADFADADGDGKPDGASKGKDSVRDCGLLGHATAGERRERERHTIQCLMPVRAASRSTSTIW